MTAVVAVAVAVAVGAATPDKTRRASVARRAPRHCCCRRGAWRRQLLTKDSHTNAEADHNLQSYFGSRGCSS